MPDVWANLADLDAAAQDRLAGVLETRGADAQQQAMRLAFLSDVEFGADARVLEVGCGTGVLTRVLARRPGVGTVVGVDLAVSLLAKARALASELDNVTFEEADARSLPFEDESFDVVVFDSTLTHVPGPDRAVAEAFRVLRPLGRLAAFDGDYSTTSVAVGEDDPLQVCVNAMMAASVNDRWVARRLRTLVRNAGFETSAFRSHGFAETTDAASATRRSRRTRRSPPAASAYGVIFPGSLTPQPSRVVRLPSSRTRLGSRTPAQHGRRRPRRSR